MDTSTFKITDSIIQNNSALIGGAIYYRGIVP